jgi:outer membrane translocation and assembly module TamA
MEERAMLKHLFPGAYLLVFLPLVHAQTTPEKQNILSRKEALQKVVFQNATLLSEGERRQIAKKIRLEELDARANQANQDLSVLAEEAGERVREAYQDKGYFEVEVASEVRPVAAGAGNHQVDFVIKVLKQGQQYWLRDIHWKNMTAFSEQQLLALTPIHPGDIFSRSKIAQALEAVRQLYGSHGYINFTSIPNTEIDEAERSIALNIDVDEGGLFRFGNLVIVGLDSAKAEFLQRAWGDLRGQPFSQETLRRFFNQLVQSVPPGVDPAEYTMTRLSQDANTVDISITFAPQSISVETKQ